MKTLDFGKVQIPVLDYASQGNAFLGIRASGKTYSATKAAEGLLDTGIPILAFDPIGIWRYLKVPGQGKGYKVVVAGGVAGDLPLTAQSAPEIVRAAMRENVSLVLDLYSMEMSKADWKKIVASCLRILLYENKQYGLRHIFIEEAAEFMPQKICPDQGIVYAECEKLCRMGGNASLGYTLINQRGEELNKAGLELCDSLFLHRQKGRNSLTALGKWLDFANTTKSKEIVKSLPLLKQGECWIWSQGSDEPVHTHVPKKNSFHPDRRDLRGTGTTPQKSKAIDVSSFVEKLKAGLKKDSVVLAEVANTATLKKRVRELESENKTLLERLHQAKKARALEIPATHVLISRADLKKIGSGLLASRVNINATAGLLEVLINNPASSPEAAPLTQLPAERARLVQAKVGPSLETQREEQGALSPCQLAIMKVLISHPDGCVKRKLLLLSCYKWSGSFQNALSSLRSMGYLEGKNNETMRATEQAMSMGWASDLPTGPELAGYWLNHPSLNKAARAFLRVLLEHPQGLNTVRILELTGYSWSGSTQNAFSALRTAGVITGANNQIMKVADELL